MKAEDIREPTPIREGSRRFIAVPVLEQVPDVPEKDRLVLVVICYPIGFRKDGKPKLERRGREFFNDRGPKLSKVEEWETFKKAYREFKILSGKWPKGDEART